MNGIEVHNLSVSYRQKTALWNIDFDMPAGKMAGIIGPNGSGKSTLLKAMMGLLPLDSGYVRFFGKNLDECRTQISYVPQRESVDWNFPISVREVVEMGRLSPKKLWKRLSSRDKEIAEEAMEKVGILPLAKRQIGELSGGQQQRVFIARALAQQADVYIMDEPFAGVDAASEEAILQNLKTLNQEGKTLLVVHHDLQSAQAYFDWFIVLNNRLIAAGEKEDVLTPDLLNEAYGGQLNLIAKLNHLMHKEKYPKREKMADDKTPNVNDGLV